MSLPPFPDRIEFLAYLTPEDERPLWSRIAADGGRVVRLFSPVWPPAVFSEPPALDEECLALWYPDVVSEADLMRPDLRPERTVPGHGLYEGWELPFVRMQRRWGHRQSATIFNIEVDVRAFHPNRIDPDTEAPRIPFTHAEIADAARRIALLRGHLETIRAWLETHTRRIEPHCYAGAGAWEAKASLREGVAYRRRLDAERRRG